MESGKSEIENIILVELKSWFEFNCTEGCLPGLLVLKVAGDGDGRMETRVSAVNHKIEFRLTSENIY